MSMNVKAVLACATLALALAGGTARADTLVIGGGWDPFFFGDVGSSFSTDFTFTGPADFRVTDAYLDGDQFDITINGVDQGPTSTPVNDGTTFSNDYDAAFASPLFSHGSYELGPGTYLVTGTVVLSPYGGGGAAAELVAATPLPSTWTMLIAGFIGLGFLGYRRTKKGSAALAAA